MELEKTYNHKSVEDRIYKLWEESGFFTPENLPPRQNQNEQKPASAEAMARQRKFVTCIAPPNITGELHLGHTLQLTLQDIIVRMKRMQGYITLWVPGIDHAGIGAQNIVEKQLAKEGIKRQDLGREKFLERMWQWKEKYGNAIMDQFKKLGISADWTRLRFTMDDQYQEAVKKAFQHFYEKDWIYKGERVVNWCPRCASSISDLEVNYVPEAGKLYFIKYGPFIVATTRPETRLGDTGLAVHPEDARYKNYVNKEIEVETIDNEIPADQPPKIKKIKLPMITDSSVDKEFGTGIVKVTPAHDLTDFEIGQRNNLLSIIVIDEHTRMNENSGLRYRGLKTKEAREQIVKDLETLGLIEKIENYNHNIGRCDRCNSVIEPLLSKQWFFKMETPKQLALEAIDTGQIKFHPARWATPYRDWLKNLRDWNISRQLWWGHQLPVYFCKNKLAEVKNQKSKVKNNNEEFFIISENKPKQCPICKDCEMRQSEDVLDTWFSSALWPFATLGWPTSAPPSSATSDGHSKATVGKPNKKTKSDFEEYYPTDLIVSARDILYLWIVRMIFSGMELTKKVPFKDILIHATVLTKDGKRMSKSLGTGINPLELTEKYGTDALRFGLASQASELQDIRFGEDTLIMGKKFANKLWNISRYVITKMKHETWNMEHQLPNSKHPILQRMNSVTAEVTEQIENYNFAEAANTLYRFIWHEFADKYIEESKNKDDQETKDTLAYLLLTSLKLLHPFMPFLTEEIYGIIQGGANPKNMLLVQSWPTS
ncbi:MAG: valine--tRNA ligase [Parcubacteria group bacterium]|nr:valine--tRNA ligase [Parcubacteria group bacterium]